MRHPDLRSVRRCAALVLTATALLAGCAVQRGEEVPPPPLEPPVAEATWQLVERDVVLASLAGRSDATAYARQAITDWIERVRQYAEEDFIPWYTGYWTQEWLALKVALSGADDDAAATEELARHLQAEFAARVLAPASEQLDPSGILRQATATYLGTLRTAVAQIGRRHRVPERALGAWLDQVSAIAAADPEAPGASLGELVGAGSEQQLQPYSALLEQVDARGVNLEKRLAEGELAPAASAVAADFVARVAARGGAAAATFMGGPVGAAISIGLTGWSLAQHEQQRPEQEVQLRAHLDAIRARLYRALFDDPDNGVLGAVNHIHAQIVAALRASPRGKASQPYQSPW
ncbi:MAG: hypothetical protein RLZ44_1295 [Pseudomonadota bacterium]